MERTWRFSQQEVVQVGVLLHDCAVARADKRGSVLVFCLALLRNACCLHCLLLRRPLLQCIRMQTPCCMNHAAIAAAAGCGGWRWAQGV
jgi:hypothetical protein